MFFGSCDCSTYYLGHLAGFALTNHIPFQENKLSKRCFNADFFRVMPNEISVKSNASVTGHERDISIIGKSLLGCESQKYPQRQTNFFHAHYPYFFSLVLQCKLSECRYYLFPQPKIQPWRFFGGIKQFYAAMSELAKN